MTRNVYTIEKKTDESKFQAPGRKFRPAFFVLSHLAGTHPRTFLITSESRDLPDEDMDELKTYSALHKIITTAKKLGKLNSGVQKQRPINGGQKLA